MEDTTSIPEALLRNAFNSLPREVNSWLNRLNNIHDEYRIGRVSGFNSLQRFAKSFGSETGFGRWFIDWQWSYICQLREVILDGFALSCSTPAFLSTFSLTIGFQFLPKDLKDRILSYIPPAVLETCQNLARYEGQHWDLQQKLTHTLKRIAIPILLWKVVPFLFNRNPEFKEIPHLHHAFVELSVALSAFQGVLSAFRLINTLQPPEQQGSRWNPINYLPSSKKRREAEAEDVFNIRGQLENPAFALTEPTVDKILLVLRHMRHAAILYSHFYVFRKYQTYGNPGSLLLLGLGVAAYLATFPI